MPKRLFLLIFLVFGLIMLSACGPSEEELAATSQIETAVSFAATETAKPTETPIPTATYTPSPTDTPTITPTFTPTHTPSLTPTPEPATVYGNLEVELIPYDGRVEIPDPLGDLTLIFESEDEEDLEFQVVVTDHNGGFSIQLPEGTYGIDLEINVFDVNLNTGNPKIQVPETGCIYIGKLYFSYYRLPPVDIAEQLGLAMKLGSGGMVSVVFQDGGGFVEDSTEITLPGEGEWVEGSEACVVSLASLNQKTP